MWTGQQSRVNPRPPPNTPYAARSRQPGAKQDGSGQTSRLDRIDQFLFAEDDSDDSDEDSELDELDFLTRFMTSDSSVQFSLSPTSKRNQGASEEMMDEDFDSLPKLVPSKQTSNQSSPLQGKAHFERNVSKRDFGKLKRAELSSNRRLKKEMEGRAKGQSEQQSADEEQLDGTCSEIRVNGGRFLDQVRKQLGEELKQQELFARELIATVSETYCSVRDALQATPPLEATD